ncbi:MAG: di-trans,poly-cis-decaprenylcistransferase [Planctomycetes bacterium]|nr:di-trans,poly-cis-decaprenylcistransferase [Planctomycetota bacterium]
MSEPLDVNGLRHVAVIMDGNGRWAEARGLVRTRGHRVGVDSVRQIVTESARAGLPWLSLFALSTENYQRRPRHEVRTLMALLRRFMIRERPTFMDNDVRLRTVGLVDDLPPRVVKEIRVTEELTKDNGGTVLCLALNYGGRRELLDAARRFAVDAAEGRLDLESATEDDLARRLDDETMPEVDLLIRTAGEMRISNFLLWQMSYAEIFITPTCWPEFRLPQFEEAVAVYQGRTRRFGRVVTEEDR